jgi:transposase
VSRRRKYKPIKVSELSPLPPHWLNLPGVQVQGKILETERIIVVQAIAPLSENPRPACPTCGSRKDIDKADYVWSNFYDVERDGKLVCIVLGLQRGKCTGCNRKRPFRPPLSFCDKGRRQRTQRLTHKGKNLFRERESTSSIAKRTGMSRRTAQSIASEAESEQLTPQEIFRLATEAPDSACVIQIDDSHPSNGTNTAILLNAKPWELLEFYTKEAIKAFFLTLTDRSKVRVYVCDMREFLFDLGRTYFVLALIVADPYHVLRDLLRCFDAMLAPLQAEILDEYISAIKSGLIVRPKRARHISRKQRKRAKKKAQPQIGEIKILLHAKIAELDGLQRLAVKHILRHFPQIRADYKYLQRVMALYHIPIASSQASEAFDRYETKMPEETRAHYATFLNTCEKYRDYICAFWNCGWSNAELEAQNGVIARLDKRAYGLLFPELRREWLYGRSTTAILGEGKPSTEGGVNLTIGRFKKEIRALRTLSAPGPVPIARPRTTGWLF